jgi:1-acyl-sn-glycerol-3-phosphate acyltransferase
MKIAFRKIRILAHLLHGMWTVATRFSGASAETRTQLTRAWSLKLLRLAGVRLVVHNDAARLDEGVLVVSNHVSWIDIYVINAWRPTPFVSKAEIRNWPVVGWLAHKLDTVFIHREKRSDAKRIMHELASRLDSGARMCVFPEGTTSEGRGVRPFHTTRFQAPVSASRPVQPVCLMYEDANGRQSVAPAYIDDVSLGQSLDALLRAGPITAHVYIGEALAPGADRRALAAEAEAAVRRALEALQGGARDVAVQARAAESPGSADTPRESGSGDTLAAG